MEVDLFVLSMTRHCLLWFSLSLPSPLSRDTLGQEWPKTIHNPFDLIDSSFNELFLYGLCPGVGLSFAAT